MSEKIINEKTATNHKGLIENATIRAMVHERRDMENNIVMIQNFGLNLSLTLNTTDVFKYIRINGKWYIEANEHGNVYCDRVWENFGAL